LIRNYVLDATDAVRVPFRPSRTLDLDWEMFWEISRERNDSANVDGATRENT